MGMSPQVGFIYQLSLEGGNPPQGQVMAIKLGPCYCLSTSYESVLPHTYQEATRQLLPTLALWGRQVFCPNSTTPVISNHHYTQTKKGLCNRVKRWKEDVDVESFVVEALSYEYLSSIVIIYS